MTFFALHWTLEGEKLIFKRTIWKAGQGALIFPQVCDVENKINFLGYHSNELKTKILVLPSKTEQLLGLSEFNFGLHGNNRYPVRGQFLVIF